MTTLQKLIAIFRQNQKYQIAVFIILLFLGWFYWFQWRPAQIRQECIQKTYEERGKRKAEGSTLTLFEGNNLYRKCLVEHGLKAEDVVKTDN